MFQTMTLKTKLSLTMAISLMFILMISAMAMITMKQQHQTAMKSLYHIELSLEKQQDKNIISNQIRKAGSDLKQRHQHGETLLLLVTIIAIMLSLVINMFVMRMILMTHKNA
ncbi:MAG: hypothetical protein HQL50_07400 [Magnetococcales bacterium]|nr:hypothetical protein [Magnetococcales bacterium]